MENATNTNRMVEGGEKKIPKPNNMFVVPTYLNIDFFKWWCIFLRPFISLTPKEIDVVSSFLMQRWLLSEKISDPAILDEMVMSENIKNKVIDECNITLQHFYVIMSNLRKNKVIVDNKIDPRLIPNVKKDDNGAFMLLIKFKWKKNA